MLELEFSLADLVIVILDSLLIVSDDTSLVEFSRWTI